MTTTYQVRPAAPDDMPAILGLIGSAAAWLHENKDTDQWARPWPNERDRDARVARGIARGRTWMVGDDGTLVGTVTCHDGGNPRLWRSPRLREDPTMARQLPDPAIYVSRLIVARDYAGRGIGGALIDWAGARGRAQWGARWIRVDVWTTNTALHQYYKGQGFRHLGTLDFEDAWEYPSAALFQKATADVDPAAAAWFAEKEVSLAGR